MIEDSKISFEETYMRPGTVLTILSALILLGSTFAGFSWGETKLIQVKPSYAESSHRPSNEVEGETGYSYRPPSPRDQMYIFWILGKMLSYPIDKVEDFITSKLKSRQAPEPVAAPAVATSRPNPFDSVNFR